MNFPAVSSFSILKLMMAALLPIMTKIYHKEMATGPRKRLKSAKTGLVILVALAKDVPLPMVMMR